MAQIGIALAGRHPGFNVFSRINWAGPDPEDKDIRASSAGTTYVSAVMKSDYDTYELVICNFVSNGNRAEAFRIVLRVPHGYIIVDDEQRPVSPSFILGEVNSMLAGNPLVTLGSTVRFAPGTVVPIFPDGAIQHMLGRFSLNPCWGSTLVMYNDANHPFYVEAAESDIPALLSALPLCRSLEQASTVYFGHFVPSAQPVFSFTPEQLAARPAVLLRVSDKNNSVKEIQLGIAPVHLSSVAYGYDPRAYVPVEADISYDAVMTGFRTGVPVVSAPGLNVSLNAMAGTVEVSFAPAPLQKTFMVNIGGVNPQHPLPLSSFRTRLLHKDWTVLDDHGFTFSGEAIMKFEYDAADSRMIMEQFSLVDGTDYRFEGASLTGNTINLTVRYVEPPKPTPAPNMPLPPVPVAPNGKAFAVGGARLLVTAPAMWRLQNEVVSVQSVVNNPRPDFMTSAMLVFAPNPVINQLETSMDILPLPDVTEYHAFLGMPPRYEVDITVQEEGVYCASFQNGRKIGFFKRLSDTFSYKYDSFIKGSWRCWRLILPAFVGLILMIAGIVLGVVMSDNVHNAIEHVQQEITDLTNGQEALVDSTAVQPAEPSPEPDNLNESAPAPSDGHIPAGK